ncbi:MAG TPA: cytochrome c3 family protein [Pyrinomonadaceae bacterium]
MKVLTILVLLIGTGMFAFSSSSSWSNALAQEGRKPKDEYVLGSYAKLGGVKFSHVDHVTKNRSVDGTRPIACVECHHTAQPASEVVKHPPHKTAWPADRTTTLTADLLEKDPNAPPVNVCGDCHARAGMKSKLLPELPKIQIEGSAEPVTLDNQQAFHRNCSGCHDEVAKTGRASTGPTSKKCVACHKKTAAA